MYGYATHLPENHQFTQLPLWKGLVFLKYVYSVLDNAGCEPANLGPLAKTVFSPYKCQNISLSQSPKKIPWVLILCSLESVLGKASDFSAGKCLPDLLTGNSSNRTPILVFIMSCIVVPLTPQKTASSYSFFTGKV